MLPRGLLISAPASGTGKTTLTLGLLAAFRARGVVVQPFKSGPDYIDPAFHTAAAGRVSVNLDAWAMGADRLAGLAQVAKGADLVIAEGSMGLFDGVAKPGEAGTGASADIAALMGWPVVLVLDVGGQAQSAAAVALGFAAMRADVRIAGVVLNKVASPRHEALVRDGMDRAGIRVFGALPRKSSITLPERHLGLVQAEELPRLAAIMAEAGEFVATHIDLDALQSASAPTRAAGAALSVPPPAERIALARDAAFSFVYPHLLEGWRRAGTTILPFSPLADEAPDDSAGACWLPGGYPELHAGRLAAAGRFRKGLTGFAETRPVHGECGGYMAMGQGIVAADGTRHEMAGLLGLETSFEKRRMHLGYRLAETLVPMPAHAAGARLRGHEFHYATILSQPNAPLARVVDATGADVAETGSWRGFPGGGRATGTFFHLIAEAT
ncbi:cobyrinate a,c-diamide synthase [Paragemmobacter straminiformis]|uniref:Hydrogenobyrinate a,c-diamide synthase n=1 Tax=Paragemmobacter straminiformis TaxID=2045119 RepID=A0A842I3P2_9RHOB|nr:cobyrinate a,c-diamide synthase [Gemmobacter straminiformis]MBC2834306.1 cobyrinate a,c-diamide synthase [Gemmobacter straminiformis]